MNHHPMPPYGQPPVYQPRRQHDMPYPPMPLNMRQPYPNYYPPHMGGPMPQYPPPHFQPQWYPYNQYPPHMPHFPRQYHQPPPHHQQHPYQPLVVSSYQATQPQQAPAHVQPPMMPVQSSERPPSLPPQSLGTPLSPPPPSTPSSINNVQDTPPASSAASIISETASQSAVSASQSTTEPEPEPKAPFEPPLPWLSVSDQPFPPPARRIRRKLIPQPDSEPVQLPSREQVVDTEGPATPSAKVPDSAPAIAKDLAAPLPSEEGTPQTSVAASDNDSTQPTTPSSAVPNAPDGRLQQTPTQPKSSRSFAPAVPVIPAMPTSPVTPRRQHRDSIVSNVSRAPSTVQGLPQESEAVAALTSPTSDETSKPSSPPKAPKSWADLVRSEAAPAAQAIMNGAVTPASLGALKSDSLADVLVTLSSDAAIHPSKLSFLEPKGLVNTGNMCYMNSILQTLIFCVPFYELLDRLSREAVHSFKSDTPLLDAMILFMKEYAVIDSANSAEKLRLRLKQEELEQYGDSFIPENVYEVIRTLPRFRDMRRGHQQDAQEFLGFLLEELHEECAMAMSKAGLLASADMATNETSSGKDHEGWMEVGHKQKASTTTSSGIVGVESPVTKIFAGKLRSELRIPGVRQSNTVEPFESLQLDIGSTQVDNIIDALKGLSKPEAMQGEFNSPRGKVTATKQVYIEELPPVLILHLKRFQYDNNTKRTEKIWKKVGYPLDLEIPREAFPPQARNKMLNHGGFPRYRLIGAIYHHGKFANGGHYTVDVRRQDGLEWIRLDDTVIRRVRAADVAEGGSEEDPKVLAAALERHKRQAKLPLDGNIYDSIHGDDFEDDAGEPEKGWNQVNGSAGAHSRSKSTMSVVNGISTPATAKDSSGIQTPNQKYHSAGVKDNKVAYLLFYQRVDGTA